MSKTIPYTCTECLSQNDIDNDVHNDDDMYVECECGERCAPTDSSEIQEKLIKYNGQV